MDGQPSSAFKEWRLWLVGWLVYPFVTLFSLGASPEYRQVRVAIRTWLHAWPNRELRREIHRLSAPDRRPAGGL